MLPVNLKYSELIDLALQQNALPFVQEIAVHNDTGRDLGPLQCLFSSPADFIQSKTIVIANLKAGEDLKIEKPELQLNGQLLLGLTEAMAGTMHIEIRCGDEQLFQSDYPVTAYPADQWLGSQYMPELLCSFVTPNLDIISSLLPHIAKELEKATGSGAINGYQQDRERVCAICTAIYRTLHTWGIQYTTPPSSFGTPGQRVRLADAIYKFRVGTCLDLTLLFASVMEQCGLHPVIMLQKGHAYIGCHLVDRYFPELPLTDLQTIRKMVDVDEFLVLETTLVTENSSFSVAEYTARTEHLNLDGDFECAIDVIRARYSGVNPLSVKRSADGLEYDLPERDVKTLGTEQNRTLQQPVDLSTLEQDDSRKDRLTRWSQKLLDLSLRNRLLNFRDTQLCLPLACANIAQLEDIIAANEVITLKSLEVLLGEKDLRELAKQKAGEFTPEFKELLHKELRHKHLWASLPLKEAAKRMKALYYQSKTDLEEGGVNTLFIGVGFLEWKETPEDEKSYQAPILLLPVCLTRTGVRGEFLLSRIDEDPLINETLLELMRTQFHLTIPGLSPLPTDDSGVDVPMVLNIFRQAVKDLKGWEVCEETRLGIFSFNKFIMWTDMTSHQEDLRQNDLVNHLIEGGGLYDDGIEVFPPEEIEKHLDLQNLFCPMSADSSQLAAILYSTMGKSFVLHGPPGTGKSQTITNIIAQNLALGRRVLFVSEKKAALDVVHKRLSNIGLSPFCLELHSNKSGKANVVAQFAEALRVPDTQEPGQWAKLTEELKCTRDGLTTYVHSLHKRYPNGLSAYDCFNRLLDCAFPQDDLLEIPCTTQSQDDYAATSRFVEDLTQACRVLDSEGKPYLSSLKPAEWSPLFEKNLTGSAQRLLDSVGELTTRHAAFCDAVGLPASSSKTVIAQCAKFAEDLTTAPAIPQALLTTALAENKQSLLQFSQIALRLKSLQAKLAPYHLDAVRSLDVSGLESRIQQNAQSFFLIRFFKNRSLLKELSSIKKVGGTKLTIDELVAVLPDFKAWLADIRPYEEMLSKATQLLGDAWQGDATDWSKLSIAIDSACVLLDDIQAIVPQDGAVLETSMTTLQKFLTHTADVSVSRKELAQLSQDFIAAWQQVQKEVQDFSEYSLDIQDIMNVDALMEKLTGLLEHVDGIRYMLRYKSLEAQTDGMGLAKFAEALNAGRIDVRESLDLFQNSYAAKMLNEILEQERALAQFDGLSHKQKILKFRELDDQFTTYARQVIFARLAAKLPRRRSGTCPEGTELGLLKRECEKKTRFKPIRVLLAEIPTLTPILKPCFLMSPLSVAQYLPADAEKFDLVVFDEASQIPVWDAIGVIARAKQLIVVGDPKQMPPTNFFQKSKVSDDEEEMEEIEDLESILDECLAAGVHSSYLNWHYRSRHEDLIAFSNHYYYDDRLFTFPAALLSDRLGVKFQFVEEGVYDRCHTRTNRKEAEAMVKYIFDELAKSGEHKRSIGVVTFSETQRNLIEDLLEAERARHLDLEPYFNDDQEEPPFVKNLENVQGDERDVILFSICYAPDAEGKFAMNFGPLNQQGGERRLNVAITRAKEQVVVFSSIHASQIDLNRTNATGAVHLKNFLDYVEKGLPVQSGTSAQKASNALPKLIDAFLQKQGYVTELGVGCSGYRIDLAVKNPDKPDEFLMAIECDGPSYALQKTERDRDHLRHDVLCSLGWHVYQAWSMDWKFDRKHAESDLLAALEEAKKPPKAKPVPPAEPPGASETVVPLPPPAKEPNYYKEAVLTTPRDQDSFYEVTTRRRVREQLAEVIRVEAPIYETLLRKRIIKAWGFTRSSDKIQAVLDACMPTQNPTTTANGERIFWADTQKPEDYHIYRPCTPDNPAKRAIDEIPPEEIANAMRDVLLDFTTCDQEILFRETMKLLGLAVVTPKARTYLQLGYNILNRS